MDQHALDITRDYTMDMESHEPLLNPDGIENVSYYDIVNPDGDNYISRFAKYDFGNGVVVLDQMNDDDRMAFNTIARYSNTPTVHFKQHTTPVDVRHLRRTEVINSNHMQNVPSIDLQTGRANSTFSYNPNSSRSS